jgi:hypothetical protein
MCACMCPPYSRSGISRWPCSWGANSHKLNRRGGPVRSRLFAHGLALRISRRQSGVDPHGLFRRTTSSPPVSRSKRKVHATPIVARARKGRKNRQLLPSRTEIPTAPRPPAQAPGREISRRTTSAGQRPLRRQGRPPGPARPRLTRPDALRHRDARRRGRAGFVGPRCAFRWSMLRTSRSPARRTKSYSLPTLVKRSAVAPRIGRRRSLRPQRGDQPSRDGRRPAPSGRSRQASRTMRTARSQRGRLVASPGLRRRSSCRRSDLGRSMRRRTDNLLNETRLSVDDPSSSVEGGMS